LQSHFSLQIIFLILKFGVFIHLLHVFFTPGSLMLYDIKSSSYLERDLSCSLSGSVAGTVPLMTACLFNHNSQMLLAGATDGKLRIFDLRCPFYRPEFFAEIYQNKKKWFRQEYVYY
jgi:hypothetical protein